ncbi:Hypothetical predicted protein [Cloeon dipterum]|uniref:Uncharacterized protein n=1 Tax=Cloeon dipterum TaxID=197152 RepID=A0A8S1E4N8_9INSE|nr:Hypothetical predicted protein [Cloeon dipterum]CAB3389095.1 Hypothetical predicted protein [Cloeon dipterum]
METDPVEDHAVPKDDTTLNAIDSSENGNANASNADDDAAPSDQSNHNEAAVQEADPFADSPPLECQRVPDNRFPNDDEERGRKSAALERQMADHEIERIVIQKKMADFKHQLEVLKKKNQALMNDPALQTITKSHRPSFEHDSVHALERAGANRETPAEDSYL